MCRQEKGRVRGGGRGEWGGNASDARFCRLELSRRGCHRHQRWWSRLVGANGVFRAEKVRCATRTHPSLTPQHTHAAHAHTRAHTRSCAIPHALAGPAPCSCADTRQLSRLCRFLGATGSPQPDRRVVAFLDVHLEGSGRGGDFGRGEGGSGSGSWGGMLAHAAWGVRRWMGRWEGEGDGEFAGFVPRFDALCAFAMYFGLLDASRYISKCV